MSRFLAFALIASVIGFGALPGGKKEAAKEEKKMAAKPVSIPKEEIYTTSSEGGFKKRLLASFHSTKEGEKRKPVYPYSHDLEVIGRRHGVSSAFVVRGSEIAEAVYSTRLIHGVGWSPDSPPDDVPLEGRECWLAVYLGTGHSEPPKWKFRSCSQKGNTIEFTYDSTIPADKNGVGASSTDGIQYFYWVPLPKVERGTFELKLIDAKKGPRLIRFMELP